MRTLEDDLRAALRAQAQALHVPERPALDRDTDELGHRRGPRWLAAAACLALIAAGVVLLAQRRAGDPQPAPPVAPVVPDTTTPAPVTNGWVAFDSDQSALDSDQSGGGDIYLVRPGQVARRLEVAGSDTADDACPAWSPDGTRLLFGRLTGSQDNFSDAELVIVPVGLDGTAGAPTVIALDGFDDLDGFEPHPCGVWAPDGRWVALGAGGEVWVVDTQTGAIRRLPDLRPLDLEWRPGTDQLAIAGDMGATDDRGAPPTRLRPGSTPHVVARRLDIGVHERRKRPGRAVARRRRRRQRTIARRRPQQPPRPPRDPRHRSRVVPDR
jgi:hypothetical protein